MTWRNETAVAAGQATAEQAGEGRPLTVALVGRRAPAEIGGVERVVAALLAQLPRTRPAWRVEAISAFRPGSRIEGLDGLSDLIASLRLGWRLRHSAVDVAFVNCPECLWGIRLLRRRTGGPSLVAVWHGAGPAAYLYLRRPGHPLARVLAWLRTAGERRALAADGHVAVHPRVAQDLRTLYGLSRPVTVIENAVDPAIARQVGRPGYERERTGLNAIWVGQTGYRKGLDVALAAVAEARRDLPGLRLTVVGVPPGKAADGVDWLGVIPQARIAEIYGRADLLLFPTRHESFGLVVIEAMAAGLPVIVSDAIGAGIVTDGRNGVVVAGHNPSCYAEALRRLADPAIRAAMAEPNREDALRFSIEAAGSGYAAVAESFAGIQ
jgi:glycosyltransferase involved in cell wall biosynthesis